MCKNTITHSLLYTVGKLTKCYISASIDPKSTLALILFGNF